MEGQREEGRDATSKEESKKDEEGDGTMRRKGREWRVMVRRKQDELLKGHEGGRE